MLARDGDALNDTAEIDHTVSGADYGGVTVASVVVTVDDDETASTRVTLSVSPDTVDEGAGATTVMVTARLNGGTRGSDTAVTVTVGSGTAVSGTDFTAVAGFTITIRANSLSQTGTFSLTPTGDTVDEPNETVKVSGATTVPGFTVTDTEVEITDDDDTPSVTLALSSTSISENGGISTVTASLDHASSEDTTVTVSAAPVTPASSLDYSLSTNTVLTIAAGATASSGTVTVTGVNNDVDAANKTVKVMGAASNGLDVSGPAELNLTITNDDTRGVTVSKTALEIEEGGDGTYTVELDSQPTGTVTVTPARNSGDSDVSVSAALSFTALNWDAPQTVTVSAGQDGDALNDTAEIDHTVSGADYASVMAASVTVTVNDDETASTRVTLSVSPDTVDEGAGATTVTVTARLNGGTRGSDTAVTVTVGSGTAVSGTDFTAVAGFTITIRANSPSQTGTFSLTPTGDTVDEPNETVKVSGATTVPGFTVTDTEVEITDDDDTPSVTLALSSTSISENGGISTVTASLDHASSEDTTVTVSVAPVSPASSSDYSLSGNTSLSIAAGATSSSGTVTITGVDNDVDAANKTVTVLGSVTTGTAAAPTDVMLTITDDDNPASSSDATLSALSLSGINIGTFMTGETNLTAYTTVADVASTTVTVTPADAGASVLIELEGGSDDVVGVTKTLSLSVGVNTITITVTSSDSNTVKTYSVEVTRVVQPMARWTMDSNANDVIGILHGTLTGGAGFDTTDAKEGSAALSLDGTDDWVDLSAHEASFPLGSSARSVAGWFKAGNNQYQDLSFFTYGGGGGGRQFSIAADRTEVSVGVGSRKWGVSNLGLSDAWRHVAVTYEAGGNSDTFKIYLDGALQSSSGLAGSSRTVDTQELNARIGRKRGGAAYYNGKIDDLRLYDYALTAGQVDELYNLGSGSGPTAPPPPPATYTVSSPDGSLVVTVKSADGGLSYSVARNSAELIADSPVSIQNSVDHIVTGNSSSSHDTTWTPTWGLFSSIRDYHNRLTLDLDVGGINFALIFQVYNDGLGLRFSADEQTALTGTVVNFNVRYNMKNGYQGHWPKGEGSPEGPHALESLPSNPVGTLVVNAGTDGFFALLESDLYPAENFENHMAFQRVAGEPAVRSNMVSATIASGSDFITPWRVVLVGGTPGDLLESTVAVNLASPLELADTSWIKPGKTLFNWRTLGYVTDDGFTYESNTATLRRLIDFVAEEEGLNYVQVDDGWWTNIDNGQLISQVNGFNIYTVMTYAQSRDVDMVIYVDRLQAGRVTNTTDEQLYELFDGLGAKAMKYGYRGGDVPFTRAALRSTAEKEMVINFHDNPVRLTGARRTIPNAITRQTGWGQQDARKAFEPTDFVEMAFINALLGPFDMINGIYDIDEMPSRLKGSRNPINSTIASENARTFTMFSGMVMLPDVPEEYAEKPEMFEFLMQMPTTWDDTRILHGSLPNYITTARRSGSAWFVCSVTNEDARTLSIPLDFLSPGTSYDVSYYEDDHDGADPTHYINNRETYQVRTGTVTRADTVDAIMVAGGGHCMWIRPQPMVQPSDATLSALSLSGINIGTFAGGDTNLTAYTAVVDADVDVASTTVTATPADAGASVLIELEGGSDDTVGVTKTLSLSVGVNTITITVTSSDSNTVKTYFVDVTRVAQPMARWTMDSNANDVIGRLHGTLTGGAGFDTTDAKEGSAALSLDGTDDWVNLSAHDARFPPRTRARSVAGWFKAADDTYQDASFFTYGGAGGDGQQFSITADRTEVSVDVGGHKWGVRNLGLSDAWHHVAVTFEAGGNSDTFKIYLDGALQSSSGLAGSSQRVFTQQQNARIGRKSDGTGYYNGKIDDLRLDDYAWTAQQVDELYNLGSGSGPLEMPVFYTVSSPDGSLVLEVKSQGGGLRYSVTRNGAELIAASPVSIQNSVDHIVTGNSSSSHDTTWTPTWGLFSSIRDYHNRLTLDLDVGGINFALIFQVYNDGLGLRFSADEPTALTGTVVNFNVRYNMKDGHMGHWPNSEHSPEGPHALESLPSDPVATLVVNAGTDGFFALLESDLYPAENFESHMAFQRAAGEPAVRSNMVSETIASENDFITPWRVVLVGDTPGDLLESTVAVNLASPLELADTSWIKPGKTLFNWRTLGYVTDDGFTYRSNTETLRRLIDFVAAEEGLNYVQVDDGWWRLINNGQVITEANGFDINTVMEYAQSRDVDMVLYVDRLPASRVTNTTDEQLYVLFDGLGAKAMKYGFRGSNVSFTRAALRSTAEKEMVINFHDNPVRLTGARRTIPNAITRQTGWGQQDSLKAFEPTDFVEMAFINALLGPFDMINGIYDINEMPSRDNGSDNPINSTIASENARTFTMFSGMVMLPDVPEEYAEKPEMFEFLMQMPTTWDDTRILHSSLPNYITTARRSGSAWFVCSVTNENARTLSIPLDFLSPGTSYDVSYYEDDHDGADPTHYIDNRETYQVRTGTVTSADTVDAIMVAGGGHCMWIRPQPMDATLSALSLSGINIGTFMTGDTNSTAYTSVADVASTTVTVTPADAGASVLIELEGGSDDTVGVTKTLSLSVGVNTITITVTSSDSNTVKTYFVEVTRVAQPMARWTMDSNANDVIGILHGSRRGGAGFDTSDARVGSAALSLDGSNDWVDLSAHEASFPLGDSARSVAGWFKAGNNQYQDLSFFTYGGAGGGGTQFSIAADRTEVSVSVNGYKRGRSLNLSDAWHHVAVTYEAGGNSTTFKIYLDGGLQSASRLAGSTRMVDTQQLNASIGRKKDGSDHYNGKIDDLRLYDVALTAEQVDELYNLGSGSGPTAPPPPPATYTVSSPDGSLVVTVKSADGSLSYSVTRNGAELISDSPVSIQNSVDHIVTSNSSSSHDTTWTPTWGLFSSIRDYHNRLTLDLDVGGINFALIFQVYNDGLGLRFSADEQTALTGTVVNFNVRYNMKNGYQGHWPRGEHAPEGPHALESLPSDPVATLVVNAGTDGFFALLESDLYPAENFDHHIAFRRVVGEPAVRSNMVSETIASGSDFITPWRVVLVGGTPGDLLESTVAVNLASPLELADTSWIKPGKTLFNWRTLGYVTDDGFTYRSNTATLRRLIDFVAAEEGLNYVQVDDGWWRLIDNGQVITEVSGFSIDTVMAYAQARDVDMVLYVDRLPASRVTNTTDEQLYVLFDGLGAKAMKYGFQGTDVPFTRAALRSTAEKEMVINFHDGPVRLTGARRTIPNAITRQTGWGQQDGLRAFEPTDFVKMAFINALLGPFDMINGIYDINEMPSRDNGSDNPINSTIASENARTFTMFSGMVMLPDVPEEYAEKPEMFEFLMQMPTTWDDTRILHSSLPNYITTARRSGSAWFVCSVTNENARTLSIPLDFLSPGTSYDVSYYEDDHDGADPTHYIDNRETYQVRTGTVTSADTVDAIMVAGGGHCMWIRPGPIAHWAMDNNVRDTAGNNHGSSRGGGFDTSDARVGSAALSLDGSNDWVELTPHEASFPLGSSARSVAGWFKAADNTYQDLSFFTYGGAGGGGEQFSIAADRTEVSVGVSGHKWGVRNLGLNDAWRHVAVTFEAGGNSDTIKIYLDGALQSSRGLSGSSRTVDTQQWNARIGRKKDGTGHYNGKIDDLRLYDYALTAGQVDELYNLGGTISRSRTAALSARPAVLPAKPATLITPPRSGIANAALSSNASLSALRLYGVNFGAFSSAVTDYAVAVAYDVSATEVLAAPADDSASLVIADAYGNSAGRRRTVALAEGENTISITVTAEDGRTTRTYRVRVTRGPDEWVRDAQSFALDRNNTAPAGLWSDRNTLWVADWEERKLFAYGLPEGERLLDRDIPVEGAPMGLWSDGETIWVVNHYGGLQAYRLADGGRVSGRDLELADSTAPVGLWSDGATVWVSEWLGRTVKAYLLADGSRVPSRDMVVDDAVETLIAAGVWADGLTLWLADWSVDQVRALGMSDGRLEAGRSVATAAAGYADPTGLWSDGATLWVTAWNGERVHVHALPRAPAAGAGPMLRPATSAFARDGGRLTGENRKLNPGTAAAGSIAGTALRVNGGEPLTSEQAGVSIADAILRGRIVAALGKAAEQPLSAADMAALRVLNLRHAGVVDLSGLEHAVHLEELDLGFNPVADVSPLAALHALVSLDLDGVSLSNLAPLSSLTGLSRLSLRNNAIVELAPLAELTRLTRLDLGGNQVVNLYPLSGLTELTELWADDNRISDISALAPLTRLTQLDLSDNRIRYLYALSGMQQLETLNLAGNELSQLYPLSGLTGLQTLVLRGNAIEELQPLSYLGELRSLDVHGNRISGLHPLSGLRSLVWLDICHNPIEDFSPAYGLSAKIILGKAEQQ